MEQELLVALKLALSALNQIPNHKLTGETEDSYQVASIIDKVIEKAKNNC